MKKNITIDQESEKLVKTSLKFSQHMAQFSKFLSFIFVSMYGITWLTYLIITIKEYFNSGIFQIDVLNFILQPMLIILGFYYGSKTLENISEGATNYFIKKLYNIHKEDNNE